MSDREQLEAIGRGVPETPREAAVRRYMMWAEAATAVSAEYVAMLERAERAEATVARLRTGLLAAGIDPDTDSR